MSKVLENILTISWITLALIIFFAPIIIGSTLALITKNLVFITIGLFFEIIWVLFIWSDNTLPTNIS